MLTIRIQVRDDHRPELDALLEARIYEFNSVATGIYDGTLLNAFRRRDSTRSSASGVSRQFRTIPRGTRTSST